MDNISCYLKLVNVTEKDKLTTKFEVSDMVGYYYPLELIRNNQNKIQIYYVPNRNGINCIEARKSGYHLQCCKGDYNFTSLYEAGQIDGYNVFTGEPPTMEFMKPKLNKKTGKVTQRPNPFYKNRNDGYIILTTPDNSTMEILVITDGRYIIKGIAKKIMDGNMNDVLTTIRKSAVPIT